MLSPLRNRFGIPGVISVIALVFAMLGGAYAASNDSGSGKATASAKAKKGPRGPRGKQGPAGPQGPAGANGKDGTNGLNGEDGAPGKNGTNGTNGTNGKDGKSVTVASENTGTANCGGRGGSSFETEGSGTKQYACNGEDGEDGETGFTETLPPGETETGTWGFDDVPADEAPEDLDKADQERLRVPLSFPIPLSSALPGAAVHFLDSGFPAGAGAEEQENCPGSAADPQAKAGHLCVYVKEDSKRWTSPAAPGTYKASILAAGNGAEGASGSGAILEITIMPVEITNPPIGRIWPEAVIFAKGYGTWAVTAPTT